MRWFYGTGGLGFGILETGVYNFLLIYYSQVLGLSASLRKGAESLWHVTAPLKEMWVMA